MEVPAEKSFIMVGHYEFLRFKLHLRHVVD
jgi:hypothetical protein